jgi:hypothetical protein
LNPTDLFPPAWFTSGVVTPESAADFARYAADGPDRPPRHWRWAAFRDWSEEREALTPDQCRAAFVLGEAEPDLNLGTAMMCHVLYQRTCPPDVRVAAQQCDRAAVRSAAGRRGA